MSLDLEGTVSLLFMWQRVSHTSEVMAYQYILTFTSLLLCTGVSGFSPGFCLEVVTARMYEPRAFLLVETRL